MISFFKKNRIFIIIVIIFTCMGMGLSYYRSARTSLLDQSEMKSMAAEIRDSADKGFFSTQNVLSAYIKMWADKNGLEYTEDKAGNLIFVSEGVERKKNVSPTVVCVSLNHETVKDNATLIASAAMIAKSDVQAGRKIVIFVNDEQNTGNGYRHLSSKYFRKKPKVIYMDYGSSAYMSNSSFEKNYSTIRIKAGRFEPECDTAVRVHISGLDPAVIGTGISKHPDPVNALSTLLTRLKSKSAIFQLADFEIGTNGSMYPVSMDATIMLNSYAVPSFTKYIDKRIKAWDKSYGGDYEELSYTYEVISDPEQLPQEAYSRAATSRLTNILYTLKSGLYKYEDGEDIPEGRSAGDIYGINAVIGMHPEDGAICVDLMTQAYDDACMQRILDDNTAASELFDGKYSVDTTVPRFLNEKDSLYRTFRSTYYRLNSVFTASDVLITEKDNYFTPCSFLADKNENADIIHLRLNKEQASSITNTILCYIAYKGNILF